MTFLSLPLRGAETTALIPIGGGEVLAEPFFDPSAEAIKKWKDDTAKYGGSFRQSWQQVDISWRSADDGRGPTLSKDFGDTDISDFPELILSAAFPLETRLTLRATTDAGTFEKTFNAGVSHVDEYVLDLGASKQLRNVEISLATESTDPAKGYLLWMGFRNPAAAALEAEVWRKFSEEPLDLYIRPNPEPASAEPIYHILCSPKASAELRANWSATGSKADEAWQAQIPLTANMAVANEYLFGRKAEQNLNRMMRAIKKGDGTYSSLIAAVQKASATGNRVQLRECARAAVRIAMIPNWDVSFITRFPGNPWDQRAFAQSAISYELAVALDLAGSYLTPRGRELILRRLAEDGVGVINYTVWKYPYVFTGNQLSAFSNGRIASYSVLEKAFKHVAPYTDLAFSELKESLQQSVFPDGGSSEGSAYWSYMVGTAMPSVAIYALARQRPLEELVRENFGNLDDYLATVRSTAEPQKLIMVGSGQGGPFATVTLSVLNIIARSKPNGAAASMLASAGPFAQSLDLWALPPASVQGMKRDYYPVFTLLPDTGLASSTRYLEGLPVKILAIGGAHHSKGHASEDRGSFVLEFAGETFAADPGGMLYANVDSMKMEQAERHNMLVPFGTATRPAPVFPPLTGVIPEASGNEEAFRAVLNPGPCWPDYYKVWKRSINSPNPARIEIVDDFELKQGDGVDFIWQTPLPVEEKDGRVYLRGAKGDAIITPPPGAEIKIGSSWDATSWKLTPITFRVANTSGRIVTVVELVPRSSDTR